MTLPLKTIGGAHAGDAQAEARANGFPRRWIDGSPALGHDMRLLLTGGGSVEGNHGEPAQFVVEKAFAER